MGCLGSEDFFSFGAFFSLVFGWVRRYSALWASNSSWKTFFSGSGRAFQSSEIFFVISRLLRVGFWDFTESLTDLVYMKKALAGFLSFSGLGALDSSADIIYKMCLVYLWVFF